jgi:hypothetical protein
MALFRTSYLHRRMSTVGGKADMDQPLLTKVDFAGVKARQGRASARSLRAAT